MRPLDRYGPWAVVAGASEGIGAAFARALSAGGLSVVLAARRPEPLAALAATLPTKTRQVTCDLASDEGVEKLVAECADLEVGMVVCNAAYVPIGRFLARDETDLRRSLAVNCVAPVRLARHLLAPMVERGRGGFIVMSSVAGQQGSPGIATYAATKAFGAVFAEGLWAELRGTGVDVLACVAGAVETPGLAQAKMRRAPGTVTAEVVVEAALKALGRQPRVVPGAFMKFASTLTGRILPKRTAITMIARASSDLTA